MEIHHTKHHQTYVNNVNQALESQPDLANLSVEELVAKVNSVPEKIRNVIRNNGGGHANHSLFWTIMKPGGGGKPSGELAKALEPLGGYDGFQQSLTKAALGRFGSGWAWLSLDGQKRLLVEDTANQDNPLMHGNQPILGIDVWEHAYYLKYQNRRADYIAAWFNTINWDAVNERYQQACRGK